MIFFSGEKQFSIIVNGLSVLKLFQLSNGDLLFAQHAYSIHKVRINLEFRSQGRLFDINAHYPTYHSFIFCYWPAGQKQIVFYIDTLLIGRFFFPIHQIPLVLSMNSCFVYSLRRRIYQLIRMSVCMSVLMLRLSVYVSRRQIDSLFDKRHDIKGCMKESHIIYHTDWYVCPFSYLPERKAIDISISTTSNHIPSELYRESIL